MTILSRGTIRKRTWKSDRRGNGYSLWYFVQHGNSTVRTVVRALRAALKTRVWPPIMRPARNRQN